MEDGRRLRLEEPYAPVAYLEGPDSVVAACVRRLERAGDGAPIGWVMRRDFWSGRERRVFAFEVRRVESWRRALDRHADQFPGLQWHNADLVPEQCYGFDRDVFPLMACEVEHGEGRLLALRSADDRWSTDFAMPPLRVAELRGEGELHCPRPHLSSLTLECDGRALTWNEPWEMLEGFQSSLDRLDPDVLLTDRGDAFLMPLLFTLARQVGFPLRLDRDPVGRREIKVDGRSYFSYGRILYQAPEYVLAGRWHLDRRNSFTVSHNGLEGLYEVARLSRLPMQRAARRSIGTGISSIQLDLAWREGTLIPWKKTHPEAWKTARQLLKTDRGGLVYAPEIGLHEEVVELDFVAMYPSIMSRFNVSPETVNCACCRNAAVPEIGYTICERRTGLVSRALGPIIAKRVEYKRRRNAARAAGDGEGYARWHARQDAIKWMLVSCFGYLGYRNARFGRIEAHEAVSAWSREILLRTRELCEERGWRMLHANVDCVWIVKPGFCDEEIGELVRVISEETRLPIALEGVYRWLAFLPSRQYADRPVPSRYFGAFRDGSLKYRGIECRRRDLPPYIRQVQLGMLERLAAARNAAEYRAMVGELRSGMAALEGALWRHEVPRDELLITQSLSQDPEEYGGNGSQALAARQAVAAGLNLHAGESISYLITSAGDRDRTRRVRLADLMEPDTAPDPVAYIRLLRRAMNSLLQPAGLALDEERITPPGCSSRPVAPSKPQSLYVQTDLFA
jgi:DNA polymerase-2